MLLLLFVIKFKGDKNSFSHFWNLFYCCIFVLLLLILICLKYCVCVCVCVYFTVCLFCMFLNFFIFLSIAMHYVFLLQNVSYALSVVCCYMFVLSIYIIIFHFSISSHSLRYFFEEKLNINRF